MKKLGTTDSTLVKVEADPSYETKKNVLLPTSAEKIKFPKADYVAHLSYREEKLHMPIEIPAYVKIHNFRIDTTDKYFIKTVWPKVPGQGLTGVYYKGRNNRLTFNLAGARLSAAQQDLALKAFKTIKIND
ncbi:hypothetical protein [Mucilaginibacter sp.]|uniref:hypothetical protein n=1 Tax=Mucilaginibacter sp. TaxID=1882438 RepID=UPI0032640FF8